MLYSRVADHRGYVNNMLTDKSTGQHFNSPGHYQIWRSLCQNKTKKRRRIQKRNLKRLRDSLNFFIGLFNFLYRFRDNFFFHAHFFLPPIFPAAVVTAKGLLGKKKIKYPPPPPPQLHLSSVYGRNKGNFAWQGMLKQQ